MPRSGQNWDSAFLRRSPLFRVFEDLAGRWADHPSWPSLDEYTELAEAQRRSRAPELEPLTFVPAVKKSRRARRTRIDLHELYDGSIVLDGKVPCFSSSYHDLWNAIIFASFPRAKRALHRRQYRALRSWVVPGSNRLPSRRTREQDALTVFDEGGSVVLLGAPTYEQWRASGQFLELDGARTDAAVPVIFGHALLELAQYQQPAIRSCALVFCVEELPTGLDLFECVDRLLVERLEDPRYFKAPGADAVLQLDGSGSLRLGPSAPRTADELTEK